MLKVLLVDDEQVILQGLQELIDWEDEGFLIAGTASNAKEALRFIENNQVDVILADISMPGISGLQFLKKIRTENLSDAFFIILSGFAEFSYAQEAIRYGCLDYILKPIKKGKFLEVLHKVREITADKEEENRMNRRMEKAYLARNLIAVINGKYDAENLKCIEEQMHFEGGIRYIEIELDETISNEEISDEEKRACQKKAAQICADYLGEFAGHCVLDVSSEEDIYDIGVVYCEYMAKRDRRSEKEYLESFLSYLREAAGIPVVMRVGKRVEDIRNIAKSYGTACILRSCLSFKNRKNIYYYEEEIQMSESGVVLCKQEIDALLQAVEQNQQTEIEKAVDFFFDAIYKTGGAADGKNLNINYLIFQLIHLATRQDNLVNQEEILRLISEQSLKEGFARGSKAHILRFVREYAGYLAQLRKNVSGGVLVDVEREIREHFSDNLTLKGLSEKYYVNSAYLGQLFRKKHGCSFKDYLNRIRIDASAIQLVSTDKKIFQIAEEAGYHNLDYFVSRFIEDRGCTPAQYRRNART